MSFSPNKSPSSANAAAFERRMNPSRSENSRRRLFAMQKRAESIAAESRMRQSRQLIAQQENSSPLSDPRVCKRHYSIKRISLHHVPWDTAKYSHNIG